MVPDQHHIWTVGIVAIIIVEGVVLATIHVPSDFHPRAWVVVVPTLVVVRGHLITASVDSSEQSLMVLEEVWIVRSQCLHPLLHREVVVVLTELKFVDISMRAPRENLEGVFVGPNVLRSIARLRILRPHWGDQCRWSQ